MSPSKKIPYALRTIIVDVFATLTGAEVEARLDAAQIANARVNTMADVWAHPQLVARARWVEVATPSGPVPALLPPAVSGRAEARMDAVPALGAHTDAVLAAIGLDCGDARMDGVPALGAHTAALLAEFGLDAAAIERLREDGAI